MRALAASSEASQQLVRTLICLGPAAQQLSSSSPAAQAVRRQAGTGGGQGSAFWQADRGPLAAAAAAIARGRGASTRAAGSQALHDT